MHVEENLLMLLGKYIHSHREFSKKLSSDLCNLGDTQERIGDSLVRILVLLDTLKVSISKTDHYFSLYDAQINKRL